MSNNRIIHGVVLSEPKELPTKYGPRLLLKVKSSEGKELSIWGKTSDDTLRSKRQHEQVSVYEKPNGGYELIEEYEGPRFNGLKHISKPLEKVVNDLDLPELLTEEQRVRLKAVIKQRAKLLKHCIDVMQDECGDIDDSRGVRSLGVTLFIHVSKFID
jgi:hypothetical protein